MSVREETGLNNVGSLEMRPGGLGYSDGQLVLRTVRAVPQGTLAVDFENARDFLFTAEDLVILLDYLEEQS